MKRLLGVLVLASVFFLNSGFETADSTSSYQTEVVLEEDTSNGDALELRTYEVNPEEEDLDEPQSIAEKLGGYLVASASYFFKTVVSFLSNLI